MASVKKSPSHEGYSSESESKMQSSLPGAKRRASRAGTRSVTTLTAAQLERKRANDREAQRAIRQRTKDHIENLERQITELTAQQDTSNQSKLIELMQRNEELEQENTVLKTRLNHAAAAFGCADSSGGALVSDFSSSPVRRLRAHWLCVARKPTAAFPFSPILFPPNLKFISFRAARPLPWDRERVGGPKSCADNPFAFAGSILGSGDSGMLTPGGVPSPTDRIQILSQPRPSSTPTARSVPSIANPAPTVSQPDQWQPQHTGYSTAASSPLEASSVLSDISGPPDTVRWSPHPHSHQHSTSLPVPDSPLHAVDSSHLPYSYVLDTSGRPMQYQMESQPMVSQSMSGYGTPTSNPSPHPPEFHRHLTLQLATAQQPQYSYTTHSHQGYLPTSTHPGEMAMMPQPMMGEQGHIMYHMNPNMKTEQH